MSIKSDAWIKRMCQAPDAIIHTGDNRFFASRNDDGQWVTRDGGIPVEHYSGTMVPLTEEEKRAWLQMNGVLIEPFVPGQVRHRPRLATDDEQTAYLHYGSRMRGEVVHLKGRMHLQEKIVSYGLSSYGYDVRCADEFKIFTNINSTVVDPKNFDEKSFVDFKGDVCVIPPNSFALARTVERFKIPRDVLTICLGKSTYARCGIIVNVTPFEPEWEGYVTLEFSNTTPLPAKIYANEGVAQVLFLQSDEACDVSYKDRGGKYMNQGDQPVCPKV
jgi:dCTP deaminase